MIISAGNSQTVAIAQGEVLTVVASLQGSGSVNCLGASQGDAGLSPVPIASGETQTFGPYSDTARFDLVCDAGYLTYTNAQVDLTALNIDDGSVSLSKTYSAADSYQPIAADLNLDAGAGTSDAGDSAFLGPMMGNSLGADLTKTHNYLGGVIGADSVTGSQASMLQKGGVLGIIMDGVTEADAAVVAVIDGSDPSSLTRANAAFAARMNNNNAGSGVDYGLDLYDPGRDSTLFTGGGQPLTIAKGILRTPSQVCILEGAGVPVDGTTGDNFAGPGSIYIDTAAGDAYIQTSAITTPAWKKITHA